MTTKARKYSVITVSVMVAVLGTLLGPGPGLAQSGDGGTRSVFSLGAGSRAIGLGRSFVSLADDASAVYWNPAALRNAGRAQIMAMHMSLFGDFTGADYQFLGAVYPTLNAGAFGLGYMKVGTKFDRYDDFSRPDGEGDYSESQFLISYAVEWNHRWLMGSLATGATFKVARQTVDPFSSTAPGADIGFRYIPNMTRSLSLAVNVQDFSGSEYKLSRVGDPIYRTVMAGAGYTHRFGNGTALRLMMQTDLPERADASNHFGAEIEFPSYLVLRAGFDDGDISFGMGFSVSRYGLDYAFLTRDEAGSSHPIAFNVALGKSLDEKRQIAAEAEAEAARELMRKTFEERVTAHRDRARQFEGAGDFEAALDEWQIVLEYTPDDDEAARGEAAAREAILASQAATVKNVENQAVIRTLFAKGLDFFEEDNFVRARAEWQAILAIDSLHAGATDYLSRTQAKIDQAISGHMNHANELERAGRLTEAIAEWNNVQQYSPRNAMAVRAINRIRTRIETASRDLQDAQRRLLIVSLYNEALGAFNSGQYQLALDKLDRLLGLQPQHQDARRLRTVAMRKLTPLTDAEKARIRELFLAGMRLFAQDKYAEAIAEWEKLLEIDPTNESVQQNIQEARNRLKQLGERN